LLAVDRANGNVANLYQPLHPAVLRTINWLSRAAREARVPIELCGEMAADPIQAIVLIGLGIRTLSLAPPSIPLVKRAARAIDRKAVRSMRKEGLKRGRGNDVEDPVTRDLPRHAPRFFAAPASRRNTQSRPRASQDAAPATADRSLSTTALSSTSSDDR